MKIRLTLIILVGTAQTVLSQSYHLNLSIGNSFNLDNVNTEAKNILLSDNNNLRVATNKNRLDFVSFYNLNLGVSITKKLNDRHFVEVKFLNDYAYLNLYFTYATSQPSTVNFINVTGNTIKFAYGFYNFSFRHNLLLNHEKNTSFSHKIRTRVFLLSALDILTPSFNALSNPSGSVYGNDGITYYAANGQKKIDANVIITNINRVSFRPCFGLTLKVVRKNKPFLNLQTYWGFNFLRNLAEGLVSVYEDNLLVAESKYKLTSTAWYFNVSKDISLKKKNRLKKE